VYDGLSSHPAAPSIQVGTTVAAVTIIQRFSRSVTLLWAFVVASAAILALGAVVLGIVLTHSLRGQAIGDAKVGLTEYANGVLGRYLVHDEHLVVGDEVPAIAERDLLARHDVLTVKVWNADGVLAWTNRAQNRIGRRFPLSDELREAIDENRATAELGHLDEAESAVESRLGVAKVLEVYAPVLDSKGTVIGVYEIYADASPVEASIGKRKTVIWLTTAAVFAALWLLLVLLVRGASRTLRAQTQTLHERSRALAEANRRLEENALEAVESLNATVEAKDPYTAGHSQRVQRIALAIGEELGFDAQTLEALRFGALFHDIGKIAVPDLVLTKPERLTEDEFTLIKRHPPEGARIIGKFGHLRPAVPIVRHHHERWDGTGYPDGLSADAIPLAAAVAALADAWDAMTIERPYQRALSLVEALREVREGSGTQFAPVVVDAFFRALARRPAELGIAEDDAAALAG
jgi:putative nucleotidyltransferase with HDIG domain